MNSVISNTLVQKSSFFFAIVIFKPLTATIKKLNLVHRTETVEGTLEPRL